MTDQRAVTVAQEDREAAAKWIIRSPYEVVKAEAEMIRLGHLDTQGLVQAFARHRLASVSSASAEGEKPEGLDERCGFGGKSILVAEKSPEWLAACEQLALRFDHWKLEDKAAQIRAGHPSWLIEHACIEAILAASPEPVPATNQAGELGRNLEAQRQTIEACACLVDRHPMRMDDNARMTLADAIRCLTPDESLAGDALDAKTADYNGHKPNRYLPEIPPGASLFAVNPSTGAWNYVNHAGTWQGMPNPLATQPATSQEGDACNARTPQYQGCNRPPDGWWCCSEPGHDGPCPTRRMGEI